MRRAVTISTLVLGLLEISSLSSFGEPIKLFRDAAQFSSSAGSISRETFGPGSCLGLRTTVLSASTGIPCSPDYRVQPGVTFEAEFYSNVFFPGLIIDGGGGFSGGFIDAIRPPNVPTSPLTVTFDRPVAAFGFDTNLLMGSSFTVTIDDAFTRTIAVQSTGAMQFFGFQSASTNIRRVSIAGSGASFGSSPNFFAFVIDDFSFGGSGFETAATPEPATLVLTLTGICAMIRRRRSR